jgi:NADPH:quinone reductase-like Zn-dependent oxidoreductase
MVTMKAIALKQYGQELELVDHPEPKVAPGEVLVRVKAAGVNPVDWKLADGHLDTLMETHFPMIPGWDVAGVVERVGLDVEEFAPGDEVYGYIRKDWVQLGAYAELTAAHVRMLARKPATLSWEQAAGVPLAGLTAYQSVQRVGIGAGDTVLVHAAAGGVGMFAVQIAAALGARVIGTASERNHDFVRGLGAEPVTYGEGLVDRIRALAPEGVDVALDFVGEGAVDVSRQVLKDPARVASIVDAGAAEQGGHYVWVRPDPVGLTALAELADQGRLSVAVERAFPLAQAAEAWRLSRAGHTRGKLVLTVGEDVAEGGEKG